MEELAVKIQNSSVNGDSEAVVICERVSLPDVPVMGSDYCLRFSYTKYDLRFSGVVTSIR